MLILKRSCRKQQEKEWWFVVIQQSKMIANSDVNSAVAKSVKFKTMALVDGY